MAHLKNMIANLGYFGQNLKVIILILGLFSEIPSCLKLKLSLIFFFFLIRKSSENFF